MRPAYFSPDDCRLDDFRRLTSQSLDKSQLVYADSVEGDIPIYDGEALGPILCDLGQRRDLMAEWNLVLEELSGVLVIRQAQPDLGAIDAATAIYDRIIEEERARGAAGDHFAAAGANDRVWNSLQKLCLTDPAVFVRYFASPIIDAISEAWLGKGYQMTAQINLVRPGGKAQTAHRDYHLGFMTESRIADMPASAHLLSPRLTLQGALAHCDMPVESGPTKLLPFSQAYAPGYLAYHRPEFRDYFERHCVQLPLAKGDAVFFSPALFHAAGDNISGTIRRMANLLQVSSPMGRAMETVDRAAMVRALYPALLDAALPMPERDAVIAAAAEGYAFPTNLDRDPPIGGIAPETQAALMIRALDAGMSTDDFLAALDAHGQRRTA
ncbi:MAG: phytanoyl-CoA dioxygenase family protein [Rhodobacteraceae bacterium]|nr:phytanoyl-CoA dioxygenase family protein [Paracoccaceae bacterium]